MSESTSESTNESAAGALSVEDALTAYTDHIVAALDQHKQRALEVREANAASEYTAADYQRDLFKFTTQLWSDSLRSVSHATKLARAVANESQMPRGG